MKPSPILSDKRVIQVGARDSKLSRAQVQEVFDAMRLHYPQLEFHLTLLKTTGDIDQITSLRSLDKTDFFTKEVDELLLKRAVDVGIHSAKDLPEPLHPDVNVVAITEGVDPSDVLVLKEGLTLETIPQGGRIGTSTVRREEEIKRLRGGLCLVDIRGTIEKRLDLITQGVVEGVVMAQAALIRLKLTDLNTIPLMGPAAPLQGKLAVVARKESSEIAALFAKINHNVPLLKKV